MTGRSSSSRRLKSTDETQSSSSKRQGRSSSNRRLVRASTTEPTTRRTRGSSSTRLPTNKDSNKEDELRQLQFQSYDFIRKSSRPFDQYYDLGTMLGEGAFGAVYACEHKATGNTRAVKILPKSAADEEANKLAYQEFKMMAKLDHPNIAKTYELFEDNNCFYIVTDLYKGGDLFDVLEQKGTLSEYETAMVANSLIMSVGYCHENKLVHRDLKPENVLLEIDGDFDYAGAKVIDFGLACFEKKRGDKFTESLGSLEYVAPQVLASCYGRGADVWSIGVILYVLLAGHPPFNGHTDAEIIAAIQKGDFVFSSPKWNNVSKDAKDFIENLLTFDEEARPSAATALTHKWLVKMRKQQRKEHDGKMWQTLTEALNALEGFRSRHSKFKQAVAVLVATQFLTKEDRELIDPLFRELDGGCRGSITKEDLLNAFWCTDFLNDSRTEEDMKKIMKEVNFSKTGSITYAEFAAVVLLETGRVDKDRLKVVFDYFDTSNKGDIDWRSLAKVLFPDRGSRYAETVGKKMIAEVTDQRYISFSAFKRLMLPSSSSSRSSRESDNRQSNKDPIKGDFRASSSAAVVA
ncbi:MAP kinase-activated protein kinase 2 (Fragment) [Seminavis robusta]|uniref:non-specific serine/threonine protein kinase n=1 Tax=Seminavis robusta TaxID=568900 RepID=A0A9N8HCD9_9STRA